MCVDHSICSLLHISALIDQKSAELGTYQVFGGGERICAGNMLARLQLTIMLHHLSCGYKYLLNFHTLINITCVQFIILSVNSPSVLFFPSLAQFISSRWELLNPDAGIVYLPHPRPTDGAVMSFSEL
jgi:ent-kaurenoic acid hydroxylase